MMTADALTATPHLDRDDLTTDEVCQLAGCSYRQLDYWARAGTVRPAVSARGPGTTRRWTVPEAVIVRALTMLASCGAKADVMAPAAAALRSIGDVDGGWVIVSAEGAVRPVRRLADLGEGWVLNLSLAERYVLEAAGGLAAAS